MIFFPAVILIGATFAVLILSVQLGVLLAFFSAPIVSAGYEYTIGGLRLMQIMGVTVPALILVNAFRHQMRFAQIPFAKLWLVYIAYSAFTYSFVAFDKSAINWIDFTFRALNGLAGFYVLQAYFSDREGFRKLLFVLILAGIFPLAVGIYQIHTGQIWREHVTVGLVRHNGMYHDIVTVKNFAFQTITAAVLYLAYFRDAAASFLRKALVFSALILSVVLIYKAYSKSAVFVCGLWLLIWAISFRNFRLLVALAVVAVPTVVIFGEEIAADVAQLFSKEIAAAEAQEGDETSFDRTLGGRWYGWRGGVAHYLERPLLEQLFGDGNPANIHNDFLAKLLSGGVVGLLIYLALLFSIGFKLFQNWIKRRSPLDVMGLMVFVMVFVDSIGIHVTQYTTYQWYAWGFIGLALAGLRDEASLVPGRAVQALRGGLGGSLEPGHTSTHRPATFMTALPREPDRR